VTHPESTEGMLFRSHIATQIADLLAQAVMLDEKATVKSLPPVEQRTHLWELSEGLVSLVCDRQLMDGADYFACAAIAQMNEIDLEQMPLDARLKLVREWRAGLTNWLRVFREGAPGLLRKYGLIAQSDITKIKAQRMAANVTQFPGTDRE
jgi:hypothetical protein